jgi:hypothetical protein
MFRSQHFPTDSAVRIMSFWRRFYDARYLFS